MRVAIAVISALVALGVAGAANAYPDKLVKVVVPFAAGGGTDAMSRILAERLEAHLGNRFLIDNASGAGGNIGADRVAKSDPDGYTLLIGTMGIIAVNPWVYTNVGTGIVDKLTPISTVFDTGHVIVVNPSVKAETLAQFTALAKESGDKMSYASGGVGTSTHLCGELYKLATGTKITHVPYPGNGPGLVDVMAGHVEVMFDQLATSSEHIKAGKIRPLAVTTKERLPLFPNVPTVSEAGLPQLTGTSWAILFAPKGTPELVLKKLNDAIAKIAAEPETKAKMEKAQRQHHAYYA